MALNVFCPDLPSFGPTTREPPMAGPLFIKATTSSGFLFRNSAHNNRSPGFRKSISRPNVNGGNGPMVPMGGPGPIAMIACRIDVAICPLCCIGREPFSN